MNSTQKDKQFRNIRFTIHQNLDSQKIEPKDLQDHINALGYVEFSIFQLEYTKKKTIHYQGYAQLNPRKWRSALTKDLKNAFIDSADASVLDNIKYCSKEFDKDGERCRIEKDGGPWFTGKLRSSAGRKPEKTLDEKGLLALKAAKADLSDSDFINQHPGLALVHLRSWQNMRDEITVPVPDSDIPVEIEFWFAGSGTGKSSMLKKLYSEENPLYYWKKASTKNGKKIWWIKKKALKAEVAIIEETRLGHPNNHEMIALTDGGELEGKGSFFFKRFKKVIFVSHDSPFKVYENLPLYPRYELLRRFVKIIQLLKNDSSLEKNESGKRYLNSEWSSRYEPHFFDESEWFRSELLELESKVFTPELEIVKKASKYHQIFAVDPNSPKLEPLRLDILLWLKKADFRKIQLLIVERKYVNNLATAELQEKKSRNPDFSLIDIARSEVIEDAEDFSLEGIVDDEILQKYIPKKLRCIDLFDPNEPVLDDETNEEFISRWRNGFEDEEKRT